MADLDAAQEVADRLGLTAEAARAHFLRGNLLFPRGDIEGCLREHELALELAREVGSAELEAMALGGLADAEYLRGRYYSACQRFTECVEVSRAHGFGRTEVANLPMAAITALWCSDSQKALDTALEAVEAAQRVGHGRAEMVARHGACICHLARAEFAQAQHHIENGIRLARLLGARRFEAEDLMFEAERLYYDGDRPQALKKAHAALAISREAGMAFVGPSILGVVALATDDEAERRAACAEAENMLAAGSISHNHIFFRCRAIDACLRVADYDEAERHAATLADYCPEDRMPLLILFADRGQVLARAGRGDRSPEIAAEIDRLIAEGKRLQNELALGELRRARELLRA